MRKLITSFIPLGIALCVTAGTYFSIGWWGFLVIFPWIGFSISLGVFITEFFKGDSRLLGRKISILMILPCLLIFVPVVNNENFQLEGVVLIVLAGFFSKGFIHYAIAKIFGPLIWRRGFCGWACWTAAVLEWLPLPEEDNSVERPYRFVRFIMLGLSAALPLYLVFALAYDPWEDYISKTEMYWMFASNALYYAVAIPLAYITRERRAFCKYVCPVSLIMKVPSSVGLIKIEANKDVDCTGCGKCNRYCPMGIDVMSYMKKNSGVTSTECILCSDCAIVCPVGKIR